MKKLLIILGVLITIIAGAVIFVFASFRPVSEKEDLVVFTVHSGENKIKIVENLKTSGLIRNKYAALVYIFINPGSNLQAGTYEINRASTTPEIIQKITNGDIIEIVPTVQVTFVEGKTIEDYAKLIQKNFNINEKDILAKVKDENYLKTLIDKYWFLDESILNKDLYYGLEGYLAPDTYEFYQNADIESIISKMLDNMDKRLTPYRESIEKSGYSVHEILSLAAIVEKEGNHKDDRIKIAQVLFLRLQMGKGLGCDVTTYYAVHKTLKEYLTYEDLQTESPYNTSELNKSMAGKIPVGPICNPSETSIFATLNPSDTSYLYFLANVDTGEIFFYETYAEFNAKKAELGL